MAVIFPPIENASPEGLLAIGGDLSPETLYCAYIQGIFPWPITQDASQLTWFSPNPRGVLYVNDFHMSKSFQKFLKKSALKVRFNSNFHEIISSCSSTFRLKEEGTWISDQIIDGFHQFFKMGHSYSVEVYNRENQIVGGLYGVTIGNYLSGESMFHEEANASKLALSALIYILSIHKIPFLDTQMVTPIIECFGGKEIDRHKFINEISILTKQASQRQDLFPTGLEVEPNQLLDWYNGRPY